MRGYRGRVWRLLGLVALAVAWNAAAAERALIGSEKGATRRLADVGCNGGLGRNPVAPQRAGSIDPQGVATAPPCCPPDR